jgi:hypothetical protein
MVSPFSSGELASKLPISRHDASEQKQSENSPFDNRAKEAGRFLQGWLNCTFLFHDVVLCYHVSYRLPLYLANVNLP